ncbi:MAG: hypothetical protein LBL60_03450 [Mycoplasmataceae bacterium]|jgi:hypothetical protein|nr:hypothetical protein [Mycoplasmataceae bacterium]
MKVKIKKAKLNKKLENDELVVSIMKKKITKHPVDKLKQESTKQILLEFIGRQEKFNKYVIEVINRNKAEQDKFNNHVDEFNSHVIEVFNRNNLH